MLARIIVATFIAVKSSLETENVAARRESDKDVVMKKFLPRIFAHLALACALLVRFA